MVDCCFKPLRLLVLLAEKISNQLYDHFKIVFFISRKKNEEFILSPFQFTVYCCCQELTDIFEIGKHFYIQRYIKVYLNVRYYVTLFQVLFLHFHNKLWHIQGNQEKALSVSLNSKFQIHPTPTEL